jgi:ferredoxin
MWFVRLIKANFKNRFYISRLTKKYPPIRHLVDYIMFKEDEIYYLPTDRILINQPIPPRQDIVLPSEVIRHFIMESSHRAIMHQCLCRDSNHCQNYPSDVGCIFMGEASLGIRPELGRQVSKEEAIDHLDKAIALGLVQMVGRNKLDTQWMGVGPGEKLLTVCNCCSCCCLYKVLPDLDHSISSKINRMPGVVMTVTDRCRGCGKCTHGVCMTNAISMLGKKAVISDECIGCGRCVETCPHHAIELTISDHAYIENTITRLHSKVDVK